MISNTFPNLETGDTITGITKFLNRTYYACWGFIPWHNHCKVYSFNKTNPNGFEISTLENTFANKAIKFLGGGAALGVSGFGAWYLWKSRDN